MVSCGLKVKGQGSHYKNQDKMYRGARRFGLLAGRRLDIRQQALARPLTRVWSLHVRNIEKICLIYSLLNQDLPT